MGIHQIDSHPIDAGYLAFFLLGWRNKLQQGRRSFLKKGTKKLLLEGIFAATLWVGPACADDVARLPLANSDFPISAAVTVRGDLDLVFVSGALAPVINASAPKGTVAAYGDTQTQTIGALMNIQTTLARLGLGLKDIVKMTAFMVADPTKDNKLDFAGFMAGYTKFFGTPDQPNKPARSAVQVAALVAPGALIEIEVIAAKPR